MTSSGTADRPWFEKVDYRLRALVEQLGAQPDHSREQVRVFVRFGGDIEPLRRRGLETGNVAGSVVVAALALADVPEVAAEPGLVFMELARPIGPDLS